MDDEYKNIDCGTYDRYEQAILYRRQLKLSWKDNHGSIHLETVHPIDLETRDGAEFLLAETLSGKTLRVRLDHILSSKTSDSPRSKAGSTT